MIFNHLVHSTILLLSAVDANKLRALQEVHNDYSCEDGVPVLSCFEHIDDAIKANPGATQSDFMVCEDNGQQNCRCSTICETGCMGEIVVSPVNDNQGATDRRRLLFGIAIVNDVDITQARITTIGDAPNEIINPDDEGNFYYFGEANVDHIDFCLNGASGSGSSSGSGFGDPHLKTWKGHFYEFHGECDMVLVKDTDFAKELGFEVHIRTTMRREWSFISATALKIGNDILEVRSFAEYFLNGVKSAKLPSTIGGFPLNTKAHGGKRHVFHINLRDRGEVIIKVYNEFLAVSVNDAPFFEFRNSVGLMGKYSTGELLARDGVTVIDDTNLFGLEWQVQEVDSSLFQEAEGPQYPQTCNLPKAKDVKHRRLSEDGMVSLEQAEEACKFWPMDGREACIYDVLATSDLALAEAGAF